MENITRKKMTKKQAKIYAKIQIKNDFCPIDEMKTQ